MKNSKVDMIRAWKDVEYRSSLSAEQLEVISKMPVICDVDQNQIKGGSYINTSSSSAKDYNTDRNIYDQVGDWIF